MRKRGGGVIVNVSPVQAFGTRQGVATYAASEGGINALTRAMAVDHAPGGIRVVVIRPAPVETAMRRAFADRFNGERGRESFLADRGRITTGPGRSTRGGRRPDRRSGRSPCRLHQRRQRRHDRQRSSLHPPRGAARGRLTGRAPHSAGLPVVRRSNNSPAPEEINRHLSPGSGARTRVCSTGLAFDGERRDGPICEQPISFAITRTPWTR